jgi:hypothetical protein
MFSKKDELKPATSPSHRLFKQLRNLHRLADSTANPDGPTKLKRPCKATILLDLKNPPDLLDLLLFWTT